MRNLSLPCALLWHVNSTLLLTEQQKCGILKTDLTCTSMLENPGGCTCDSQQNPCDITTDNLLVISYYPKSESACEIFSAQQAMFTCSFLFSRHHGKKSMKGLEKTCIYSTVWKNNIQNSGQILNDRVHAG